MANTFKKIQTVTVGSGGAASIQFTSIPQTYTDLKIVVSCRTNRADVKDYIAVRPNGSTSNDSSRTLSGDGSSASSDTESAVILVATTGGTATASVFGNADIYIPNYTSANNKSIYMDGVGENNATESRAQLSAGLWADTTAISSLDLVPFIGTLFSQYSTATLYGIANVTASSSAYATGGNQIYTDNTYWYHVFTSSGTFTPTRTLSCDYLVIAGGGSGGYAGGSGGGAGGYLSGTLSVTSGAKTVTVGAGGAGSSSSRSNGSNSVFDSITSTGGGSGTNSGGGYSGGSGGGGVGDSGVLATGGAASPSGQGNKGGDRTTGGTTDSFGAGGGGASAAGVDTNTVPSNGGAGSASSITGTSVTRAGGGGGGINKSTGSQAGIGGSGGGGSGTYWNGSAFVTTSGVKDATVNTGSGGGGGGRQSGVQNDVAGSGGSGIVIVRYAV
jgi:hypothetical protein